jgi:hypothetical protein
MPPAKKAPDRNEAAPRPEVDEGADVDPTDASANPFPASPARTDTSGGPGVDTSGEYSDDGSEGDDAAVAAGTPGSAPGPAVVEGAFGTTVDSNDPGLGKLRVEVRSIIAVGHMRLLEDDEDLDVDNPEHADYEPF